MTWYMKGQSDYDSSNFHMGLYFDMNGFASGDYVTLVMPTDVSDGDPFLTVAAETQPSWNPGSQNVEIGLWNDYRIKITSTGIYGRNEGTSSWVDLLVGGGASQLSELSDVGVVAYEAGKVLRADGDSYEAGYIQWGDVANKPTEFTPISHDNTYHSTNYKPDFSENTAFNKNFGTLGTEVCVGNDSRLSDSRTPLAHVLGTSGPHTGTLPWTDLNKTGSNLTDLVTRQHVGLTDVTSDQHHPQSHTLASHSSKAHSELSDAPTSAHHVRYANSEAVSAVAAADDYVKNIGDSMSGALAMSTNKVTGVGDPTANQDASTKKYTDVTHSEQVKAGFNLSGGGNVSFGVVSGKFKWTARFIIIGHGRGTHFSTAGYFDIVRPITGTCTGVGGAGDQTWSSDGITLESWTALYYILPIGGSNTTVDANFRLCRYTGDVEIPDEWTLLAVNNGDSSAVRTGIGVHIDDGRTFQTSIAQMDKLIGDATAYSGTSWNAHTGVPNKNVVRDLIEDKIFEQSATFPVSPVEGQLHYDEDDDSFYRYNAEALAWIEVGVGGGRGEADTFAVGCIISFSGSFTNNITMIGWYKCDGANGTVNLVDKFVRGGSASGGGGGSDDAILVSHNHAGSTAINAGAHVHNRRFWWGVGTTKKPNEFDVGNNYTDFDNDSSGDHGHNLTIVNNGVSGTGKNLPTYYTLIFIQRIT